MQTLLLVLCGLVVIAIVLLIIWRPQKDTRTVALLVKLDILSAAIDKTTAALKEELKENKEELSYSFKNFKSEVTDTLRLMLDQNGQTNRLVEDKITTLIKTVNEANKASRETITANLKDFSNEQGAKLTEIKDEQKDLTVKTVNSLEKTGTRVEERLTALNEQAKADGHLLRQTLEASFKGFRETFTQSIESINGLQRDKFARMEDIQTSLVQKTEEKLEGIRETVDEKLQRTLNERLGQSFAQVSNHLEKVQQGIVEMQVLAQDVGGLKKVLSNVKLRGGFGEIQLAMLLDNILAPEQYEANVRTKEGSADSVEFAIKFPNPDGDRSFVWLPVDAKFPKDSYEMLQTAYDTGDTAAIDMAQRALEATVKKMAKDICEKYIDPPGTTDFGIMFLPFEGIYAEVVRKASLLEDIQRTCKVIVTGPSTLYAILHSLRMGFRTLAIQKRSSEVWQTLGAVKKEFESFGGLLDKAQKNLQQASNHLDEAIGKRTRAIQRKLKSVEALTETETRQLLAEVAADLYEEEDGEPVEM